jgi:transcription initiation factor TFIID subunit 1
LNCAAFEVFFIVGRLMNNKHPQRVEDNTDDTWYSIFPVENEELVYGVWEDEVIWDSENMTHIPKPKILTLDPNDENIVLGIPDDIDPAKQRSDSVVPVKVKIPHPHVKKSKILLGKAGVINVMEEDTPPPPPKSPDRDPFNVSNDR